jgi:hypothetical protein
MRLTQKLLRRDTPVMIPGTFTRDVQADKRIA